MFRAEVVEKIKTRNLCLTTLFRRRTLYEIMWANIVEQDRPQMTIWRMRIACWIPKVTDTLSQYVTLIAFQWQQWFREGASIRSHVHCLCVFFFALKLCTSSHAPCRNSQITVRLTGQYSTVALCTERVACHSSGV